MLLALLAFGLALSDLSIVRAAAPSAANAARIEAAADATLSSTWAASCGDEPCQPAALAALADRPNAVRARIAGTIESGIARGPDLLARIAPLALLPSALPVAAVCTVLRDLPWRPAREAGADCSIPRPPPR